MLLNETTFSPSFGSPTCDVAYGKRLVESNASAAREIDEEARENGVTDDLLARFAPRAKGEAILLLTVAGEVASRRDAGATQASIGASPAPSRGRGGRRGRSPSGMPGGHSRGERTSFEMSASLYSVQLGRAIAVVSMTYTGSSQTEAFDKFRGELAKIFPHATCVGWDWDAR
jgi:hypothetical protein